MANGYKVCKKAENSVNCSIALTHVTEAIAADAKSDRLLTFVAVDRAGDPLQREFDENQRSLPAKDRAFQNLALTGFWQ